MEPKWTINGHKVYKKKHGYAQNNKFKQNSTKILPKFCQDLSNIHPKNAPEIAPKIHKITQDHTINTFRKVR